MVENPRRPVIHWHVLQVLPEPEVNWCLCLPFSYTNHVVQNKTKQLPSYPHHACTQQQQNCMNWQQPQPQRQRVNLELLVADYDRIGSSDPIGKVLLGYNRKGLELKHWKEMIENPRRPIVHWHVLKVIIFCLHFYLQLLLLLLFLLINSLKTRTSDLLIPAPFK